MTPPRRPHEGTLWALTASTCRPHGRAVAALRVEPARSAETAMRARAGAGVVDLAVSVLCPLLASLLVTE
jgi:hypothetical protein